ncbi:SDR family NAD(P)-dependent oxidoreductase [Glycomyces sp. NPDC048151]|uniref:SDR family NAD(P)-dependent oxidoreductase n=1 Tax=Glycomyces sp. NPDC048151 TaxID=3364002 RepID=UPI00371E2EB2
MRPAPRPTALITGAASGIGAAFARALAPDHRLVLVDRDTEGLQAIAATLDTETETVTADLTAEADIARIEERCRAGLDLLVNNAGFGHPTEFLDTPIEAEIAMSRLHVEAVLRLTVAALPAMMGRGNGGIVNTGSVLGFFPSSTYSASKAWVINFSQSAAVKARPHGVHVMVLCPGFTRTGFHDTARMNMTAVPAFLWLQADTLVAAALRDLRKGKAVSIPGWHNKTIAALSRLLPMRLILRIHSGGGKRPMAVRETRG